MSDIWEIFYTPHTDDESIGMAGAIVNAKELGHSVLVCLVTDNKPSTRGRGLFPSVNAANERRFEWSTAMAILNVDEMQLWELSEEEMALHPDKMQHQIWERMMMLHVRRTVAHHHTTWGLWDRNAGIGCTAHDLCANAASHLVQNVRARVSLYAIYEYSKPKEERFAPVIRQLSVREHAQKRDALHAYYPSEHSIGYGYASVPELMDAACTDPREFVIEVTHGHNSTAESRLK